MARTPQHSPAAVEALLGARGSVRITSDNRKLAKQWLTANSFPAAFVAGLSLMELQLAYNETDGSGLAKIRVKLDKAMADGDMDENDANPVAVAVPETPIAPTPQPQNAHDATAIGLLRDLILNGYKPGIDENQVRAIVQEHLTGIAPRVIEVKHPDGDAIKIEGLVHPEFERALGYLTQGQNVMLVGPAGCGKSHLIGQLAKALKTDCSIVSGTAGASEGDLIGRLLPGDGGRFEYTPSRFIELYERGDSTLAFDEIDGFDPNMLMIANMPLANGHMWVHLRKDNPCVARGHNVYFLATANTFGTGANPMYVGRNPMDEATRDRFIFIEVDYDKRLEESIAAAGGMSAAEMAGIWELRDRCREAQLRRVISTRAFQKAAAMKACGESWREIRDRLLTGWSKDEKAKVGV